MTNESFFLNYILFSVTKFKSIYITFEKSMTKKTDVNDKKAKNGIKSQVLM